MTAAAHSAAPPSDYRARIGARDEEGIRYLHFFGERPARFASIAMYPDGDMVCMLSDRASEHLDVWDFKGGEGLARALDRIDLFLRGV